MGEGVGGGDKWAFLGEDEKNQFPELEQQPAQKMSSGERGSAVQTERGRRGERLRQREKEGGGRLGARGLRFG